MRRVAVIALTVLVVAGAAVLGAAGGERPGEPYRAVFDNAFGLTEGGDLKIAGVRAGQTTGFKLTRESPHKAVVEFEITEPGVGELREDARCVIRPQSLIGEYFVDCQPGSSDEKLAEGGTIPVEQTSSTIPVDLVNNILRRPYRERLRLIIAELGSGLAGRDEDLAEVLRRAHPGLRETSRTLRVLADQNRTIQKFIDDAQVVTEQLENRKADVARWVDEAGETAQITATRREELKRNFALLPGFLDELEPYMVQLGNVADEQIPALADLQAAAPDLDRFLARLGPFSDSSRPAFRGLGAASADGLRAFRASQAEVNELRDLARDVPGLAKPLRQLLETLDDRKRAVEPDPRAKATGPPAPDKTHIADTGGFTGMEALWNYFYWQTLALNGRDDVGHVLKIIGIEDPDCSPYYATDEGEEEAFARCNEFLGPYQPGITAPDPLPDNPQAAASAARDAGDGRFARDGKRASDGGEADGSAPGSDDSAPGSERSAPRSGAPTLPPAVRELLGALPGVPALPRAPQQTPALPGAPGLRGAPSNESSTVLLDYLLSP